MERLKKLLSEPKLCTIQVTDKQTYLEIENNNNTFHFRLAPLYIDVPHVYKTLTSNIEVLGTSKKGIKIKIIKPGDVTKSTIQRSRLNTTADAIETTKPLNVYKQNHIAKKAELGFPEIENINPKHITGLSDTGFFVTNRAFMYINGKYNDSNSVCLNTEAACWITKNSVIRADDNTIIIQDENHIVTTTRLDKIKPSSLIPKKVKGFSNAQNIHNFIKYSEQLKHAERIIFYLKGKRNVHAVAATEKGSTVYRQDIGTYPKSLKKLIDTNTTFAFNLFTNSVRYFGNRPFKISFIPFNKDKKYASVVLFNKKEMLVIAGIK